MPQLHESNLVGYNITAQEPEDGKMAAFANFKALGWTNADGDLSLLEGKLIKGELPEDSKITYKVTLEEGHVEVSAGIEWGGNGSVNWDDFTDHSGKPNPNKIIRYILKKAAEWLGSNPFNPS